VKTTLPIPKLSLANGQGKRARDWSRGNHPGLEGKSSSNAIAGMTEKKNKCRIQARKEHKPPQ